MNIQAGFDAVKEERITYFKQYTYNCPIVFSYETYKEMKKLGQILYKTISHMVENYIRYLNLMPRLDQDLKILEICDRFPYRIGTFRTDFVVDKFNTIKIIEITTRQPLNGYFTSGFFREISLKQAQDLSIQGIIDVYPEFFKYLDGYIGNAKHICVIKGNERLEEINLYPIIFQNAGIECQIIPIAELPEKLHLLHNAWVIEELNFKEIREFSPEIISALAECRLHNAIKSILTTHDKRFFNVLNTPEFIDNILTFDEQNLLKKYLVPTYVYGKNESVWNDAYKNRSDYILKHQVKGKSVDVYAGCVTNEKTWENLFKPEIIKQMVLQPFIDQRKFEGYVGQEKRNDYVAGTLLYFNQEFFGPGLFRTSSYPVTNIHDNRKIAQLIVGKGELSDTIPVI